MLQPPPAAQDRADQGRLPQKTVIEARADGCPGRNESQP